jgi:hypothetical protein
MNTFNELDKYLCSYEFDSDDWANYASEEAHDMVIGLSSEDWVKLQSDWPHRSLNWKKLLAGLLDYHANFYLEFPILVEMIFDSDEDLAAEAAMSLANIVIHRKTETTLEELYHKPKELLARIEAIIEFCSGTYEEYLKILLGKLEGQLSEQLK